ncbi:glucan biosynthesis protein [Piscinibacter gummiphilus]|uniref:glucan biosynthesis protein n=1 Tax=Piscinibacter gummiphilus TaxID=946333 RepID=UPI000A26F0D4|nr:glucan biosynthesis protein D [Piscinibacter gummiphilus]ATU66459.1 glucan biosynthesis protein D [Piscinibacter gummiphilus]GLS95362.1 glucans biosynthesis protein D [Piscinibacter gummiphilus]
MTNRRLFLQALAAAGTLGLNWTQAFAALKPLGSPQAFDFASLKGQAKALAAAPYKTHEGTLPPSVSALDWDQYQSIRYRDDHALWTEPDLRFKAKFFHLGLFFKKPVRMYDLTAGRAQELAYDPEMFDYAKSGLKAKALPANLGFAGFRLNFHTDPVRDVAAFLGASYFRAVGEEWQYGQSARGLAIDTGMERPEEFPDFIAFYLERPAPGSNTVVVYALLDSPSIAGAYRFAITPGVSQVMEIDAALYPRKAIERLGLAPCTSMFQHGENDHRMANDWRPEIHDTDGLQMWRGNGEWVWRPLTNPPTLQFNAYSDENPRGFGLVQRDRNFDHYQDDGVFYDRRPSLWVEPKSDWGPGSVQLVEIPTNDETFDNIVAFWNPAKKPEPGQEWLVGYRLYWGALPPAKPALAQCVATRTGIGGIVGQPRKYFSWRFAVDFAGGDLANYGPGEKIEAVITASRGKVEITSARPLEAIRGWRAMFDLKPEDTKTDPITLRMFLRRDGKPLTETWLYQYVPPAEKDRKI